MLPIEIESVSPRFAYQLGIGSELEPEPISAKSANSLLNDSSSKPKKTTQDHDAEEFEEDEDEEPVTKRRKRNTKPLQTRESSKKEEVDAVPLRKNLRPARTENDRTTELAAPVSMSKDSKSSKASKAKPNNAGKGNPFSKATISKSKSEEVETMEIDNEASASEHDEEDAESEEEEKPEVAAKAREKVQATLKSSGKDPYPDWKPGEPAPYAALCTTFSLVEMTTKRLIISAHCSLFLRQVLRLTPQDLLPTVQLMINKLAADYAGIELGIGESLIMKAIGETTGRSLAVIKSDQSQIGDLGLVALKSRSTQPTMFKPKALTIRGVLDGLMGIATVSGHGSQDKKIAGIKKLLAAADVSAAGKKDIDITKDKGGASEAKFIVRFLEGKLRLGLAERTVLIALAHAMVSTKPKRRETKYRAATLLRKAKPY